MNDRVLVARLLLAYLKLAQKRHESFEHDPETMRGCTHPDCVETTKLARRVETALGTYCYPGNLEELANGENQQF